MTRQQQMAWFAYVYANVLCDKNALRTLYHPFKLEGTPYRLRVDSVFEGGFQVLVLEEHTRLGSFGLHANRFDENRNKAIEHIDITSFHPKFDLAFVQNLLHDARRTWQTLNAPVPDCMLQNLRYSAQELTQRMPAIVA